MSHRSSRNAAWRAKVLDLFRFLLAGLPSFAVAVPLNWLLVERFHVQKPLAYALVLIVQVSVNFWMCRAFVFEKRKDLPLWNQFVQFMSGILAFRFADWCVYTIAVSLLGVHYLLMQCIDIAVFSVLKYKFARRVLEHRQEQIADSPKTAVGHKTGKNRLK